MGGGKTGTVVATSLDGVPRTLLTNRLRNKRTECNYSLEAEVNSLCRPHVQHAWRKLFMKVSSKSFFQILWPVDLVCVCKSPMLHQRDTGFASPAARNLRHRVRVYSVPASE